MNPCTCGHSREDHIGKDGALHECAECDCICYDPDEEEEEDE